jgi:hypothetical protein
MEMTMRLYIVETALSRYRIRAYSRSQAIAIGEAQGTGMVTDAYLA